MQIELTILIPVYNEVNLLEKLVKNLVNTFKKKLTEKCDKNTKFYCPKIVRHKYFRNKIKKFEKIQS